VWSGGSFDGCALKWRRNCVLTHDHVDEDPGTASPTWTPPPAPTRATTAAAPAVEDHTATTTSVPVPAPAPATFAHAINNARAFNGVVPTRGPLPSTICSPCSASISSISSLSTISFADRHEESSSVRPRSTGKIPARTDDDAEMAATMELLALEVPTLTLDDIRRKYWWTPGHVYHTRYVQFYLNIFIILILYSSDLAGIRTVALGPTFNNGRPVPKSSTCIFAAMSNAFNFDTDEALVFVLSVFEGRRGESLRGEVILHTMYVEPSPPYLRITLTLRSARRSRSLS
jgi:hypothetical protein